MEWDGRNTPCYRAIGERREYLSLLDGYGGRTVSRPPAGRREVFGSFGVPSTLFYSADGKLRHNHMGKLSAASLKFEWRKLEVLPTNLLQNLLKWLKELSSIEQKANIIQIKNQNSQSLGIPEK
ncbi:hypothetical protein P3W75_01610 [Pseudomonas citronellolis]|nr:hypothetical protein [Pseudomonas citronellolis]